MKRLTVCILLLSIMWCAQQAQGQQAATADAGAKYYLAFRMQNWKAQHIHDDNQAKKQVATLKQIGCEVKTNAHNGHTDVQCRAPLWKSLALTSPQQLGQWESWLKQTGFETLHGRKPTGQTKGPNGEQLEIVKYRMTAWKNRHLHQAREVTELTTLFQALGCETQSLTHNGHTDLRIRCPEWMEIELATHAAAHQWQDFLNKSGFETQHEH